MHIHQLQQAAAYFNLRGFEKFSKNKLIEFLISNVNHRALQNYIEHMMSEDEYFGKRLETELMQQDIEEQFGQLGFSPKLSHQSISTGHSRPIGTIHVSTQTLNSLLSGMNIGGIPANTNTIKFRTGKSRHIKRLQK